MKLQSGTARIIDVFMEVGEIKNVYAEQRSNVNTYFNKIFEQAKRLGDVIGVEPSRYGVTGYQQHRPNAVTETVEDSYCINIATIFLDQIFAELERRFLSLSKTATSLLELVPIIIIERELDLQAAIELYSKDLPSPELLHQELLRWKMKWKYVPLDKVPYQLHHMSVREMQVHSVNYTHA